MPEEPKPKTKYWQFSTAQLLILLSAICALCALLSFLNSILTPLFLIAVVGASLPLGILLFVVAVCEINRVKFSERMGMCVVGLIIFSVLAWPFIWFILVVMSIGALALG